MAAKRKRRAAPRRKVARKKAARKNPAAKAAQFGKWYTHPKGGKVRVRRVAGRIVVDLKK